MTILILGAQGNLGSELVKVYADLQPVGWGRDDLDITDEQMVYDKITALKPDVVYNCAAYNLVDEAEEDRATANLINGYAVGYIARACSAVGAKLVHFSTGQVFDGENTAGYTEDDATNPINVYGRSKLLGEMEALSNTENAYIIRSSWLFGGAATGNGAKKSFIEQVLEQAQAGTEIKLVEDEVGKPTFAQDLAQAARALIEESKPVGVYHIVNEGVVSRLEWGRELFKLKGIDVKITPVKGISMPRMARRPKAEVLNNAKFLILRPWTEALAEYLKTLAVS